MNARLILQYKKQKVVVGIITKTTLYSIHPSVGILNPPGYILYTKHNHKYLKLVSFVIVHMAGLSLSAVHCENRFTAAGRICYFSPIPAQAYTAKSALEFWDAEVQVLT